MAKNYFFVIKSIKKAICHPFCLNLEMSILRFMLVIIKFYNQINITAQKMKFSIKDFSSKCDQIRRKLRIWSHLLEKSLMENFIFCAVYIYSINIPRIQNREYESSISVTFLSGSCDKQIRALTS